MANKKTANIWQRGWVTPKDWDLKERMHNYGNHVVSLAQSRVRIRDENNTIALSKKTYHG